MGASSTVVHFEIDGDRLGLGLADVSEIAKVIRFTPVPRSPDFIVGVTNIRGRVVTLMDAHILYGDGSRGVHPAEERAREFRGHAIVLAPPHEHLALFTRSPIDIGKGRATGPAPASAAADREGRAPLEGLVVMDEFVVRLIPPGGLQAHCESRVLERYRRRA